MRWIQSHPPRPLPPVGALLGLALLIGQALPSEALSFRTVQCSGGAPGLLITATRAELLSAYALVFAMSDGSTAELSDDPLQQEQQVRNILNVLHMSSGLQACGGPEGDEAGCLEDGTGDSGNGTALPGTPQPAEERLLACGDSVLRVSMLAAMGNFVSPLPAERGQQQQQQSPLGGEQLLPRVVVDVYSGKLAVASAYGGTGGSLARVYFLEALLVVSILAITRLAITRNVTITIDKVCLGTEGQAPKI